MKKNRKSFVLIAAVLLAAVWMSGCSDETEKTTPTVSRATATFSVRMPGEFNPTRALGAADENAIKTADIIAFRKDAGGKEFFFYREKAELVKETSETRVFSAAVQHSDEAQQFVLLANVREVLDGLALTPSMTRLQALDAVAMKQAGAWNVSAAFTPMPLWAQSEYKVVNQGDPELSLELTRAVARVDVNIAAAAKPEFVMKSVRYYNYPNSGRVAPLDASWDKVAKKVTLPSMPAGGYTYAASPQVHTVTGGVSLQRTIYSFETPAVKAGTDVSATCLIIGGSYKGGGETYYRVDFFDTQAGKFLPLLRNHRYDVQITKVSGAGYAEPAEALAASFSGITSTTHVWNGGGMGNVVWDGHNFLSVGQTGFQLPPEAQTLDVKCATSYATGWNVAVGKDGAGWLSIQGAAQGAGNKVEGKFTLKATANTKADRTGTVTLTAGRLTQVLKVVQKLNPEHSVAANNAEFIFTSAVGKGQNLLVEWLPATEKCALTLMGVSGYKPLEFKGAKLPATLANDGSSSTGAAATVVLTPDKATLGNFEERRSILRISVKSANGTTKTKDVLLRQFDYTLTVSGTLTEYDLSTTYSINVKSNALWEVKVSDAKRLTIKSEVKGYADFKTGEMVEFKTGGTGGEATLTFKSKEKQFADKVVKMKISELLANCYIVASGTAKFTFKIDNALKAWAEDVVLKPQSVKAMTGKRTVKLLWQDEPGLITAEPTLANNVITLSTTKGKEGNAVVALLVDGVIRWNWHIWVLNSGNDPTKNTYTNPNSKVESMDRNLGATLPASKAGSNLVKSFGLLYQHGRKDPFPGAAESAKGTKKTKAIYGLSGALAENTAAGFQVKEVAVLNNLINAIATPLTFYYNSKRGVQAAADWYTSDVSSLNGTYRRNNLWPHAYKSYFDPCPKGWRVPKGDEAWLNLSPPPTADLANLPVKNWINTSYGSFPAAGARRPESGAFLFVGEQVKIFDSSPLSGYSAFHHFITPTGFYSVHGTAKAWGYSIRCVRVQ